VLKYFGHRGNKDEIANEMLAMCEQGNCWQYRRDLGEIWTGPPSEQVVSRLEPIVKAQDDGIRSITCRSLQ
jgi:hypothetical protein